DQWHSRHASADRRSVPAAAHRHREGSLGQSPRRPRRPRPGLAGWQNPDRRRITLAGSARERVGSRPLRHWAWHDLAINQDRVDLLVEERKQPRDFAALLDRIGVVPDEIAARLTVDGDAVISSNAFVRTLAVPLTWSKDVGPHILARDVVPGRQ